MFDVAATTLATHVVLEFLSFSLMGLGLLVAIPGIIMIKRDNQLPSALLGFACGMIIGGALTLILSSFITK